MIPNHGRLLGVVQGISSPDYVVDVDNYSRATLVPTTQVHDTGLRVLPALSA